ncbi:MAG: hypothetical protein KIT80_23065 [Chitinophagaceae bacterium]|nr:hypothetical protein [Chitinophagaceae bacterium]MCW5929820.1 hypothetical protein [Chitinophagaceae bacterium]
MHSITELHINKLLFLLLVLFTVSLGYLMKELLDTDKLVYTFLLERVSVDQFDEMMSRKKSMNWLGLVITPALLFVKISIMSAVLWTGCFFFDKRISYKSLFNIAVKAEFIFLLVIIVKIIWFYFFFTEYSFEDIQYFYPLSVLNIVGYERLEPWYIYPLQVLNLFEFIYWMLLIYLLAKELNIKPDKVFNIVAGSYGVGLLIWVIAVMFFTINFS